MMAHAERCPVCGGDGKIGDGQPMTSAGQQMCVCHGCNGRGWVTVDDTGWQAPRQTVRCKRSYTPTGFLLQPEDDKDEQPGPA